MGALSAPAVILFEDVTALPRPGSPFTAYIEVVRESDGLKTTGNVFRWVDSENDYVNQEGYRVIGSWNADTNTPDYQATLTENNTALSVTVGGTQVIDGSSITFLQGDLLVRSPAGVFFRQRTGVTNVFDTVEILGDGNSQAGQDGNFVIDSEAIRLGFKRNENGTLVSKQTIGDSIDTDRMFLQGLLTTINITTQGGNFEANGYRESTLEVGGMPFSEYGDFRRPGVFLSGRQILKTLIRTTQSDIYHEDNLHETDLNAATGTSVTGSRFVYEFTEPAAADREDTHAVAGLEFDNDAPIRVRLLVEDLTTGRTIYQTRTQYEQDNGQGYLITATGLSLKRLISVLYLTPGNDYRFTLDIDGTVNFDGGDQGGTDKPFMRIHYWRADDIEMLDMSFIDDSSTADNRLLSAQEIDRRIGMSDPVRLSSFTISIPSRVDLNTNLNQTEQISYNVYHRDQLTALNLIVAGGDNKTITLPTQDGKISGNVILSGIDSSTAKTLSFMLQGTTSGGTTVNSNSVHIQVRDLPQSETVYWGIRTTNDAYTVNVSELTSDQVTNAGDTFDINGTFSSGDFLVVLVPTDHDANRIYAKDFPSVDFKDSFTRNSSGTRSINSIDYNVYTLENQGSTGTINYVVEVD